VYEALLGAQLIHALVDEAVGQVAADGPVRGHLRQVFRYNMSLPLGVNFDP
jgi:hypothetical protein